MLAFVVAACSSGEVRSASSEAAQGVVAKNGDSGMLTVSPDAASPWDAGGDDAAVFGCASPDDCWTHLTAAEGGVVPAVVCCVGHFCILGQAAAMVTCTNPDAQIIKASNYDQSCAADSDCVAVAVGNFCNADTERCPSAAINAAALSQYQADFDKTQAAMCLAESSCGGSSSSPCCRQGACQFGVDCN